MLLETGGSNKDHDKAKIESFLETSFTQELVANGTIAQDQSQAKLLWMLRENITASLAKAGAVYKYDLSVNVKDMYELVDLTRKRLEGHDAKVIGFGHLFDGNLHLNVSTPKYSSDVFNLLEPWLFEQIALRRGSISAEHGLGQSKNNYIEFSKSKMMVKYMKHIKQLFDPHGILNPYKVLPTF